MNENRPEGVRFVFDSDVMDSLALYRLVLASYRKNGLAESFFIKGVEVTACKLENIISEKRVWPSGVVSNGVNFLSGMLPARRLSFLDLKNLDSSIEGPTLELSQHLVAAMGFVHAWVYDIEYSYWQNVRDPLEYEGAGRSVANLPKRSNGLPAPLNQLEIDTSKNPGRIELRIGFIEAVGRLMWLADRFWEKVGTDKVQSCGMLKKKGFDVSESNRIVHVNAGERFFDVTSDERQQTLRRVLFGTHSKEYVV